MPHPIRNDIATGRLCRHLRTKGMYVFGDEGPPPGLQFVPDTAAFWCNCSGYALGLDRVPANPSRCGDAGRTCFEGDVGA